MIDIHSHILPGLDDGSGSLAESLAMARMAVDSGIRAMVATPHCMGDRAEEVLESWRLLKQALEENQIPLRLYPGMEIYGTADTLRLLKAGKLLTLNNSRYPLVEFGFHGDGSKETALLRELCEAGYCPVVAHPERYVCVRYDPELLNRWYRMGCLMQVNRGSLLGRFGRHAQAMAVEMVERGFAAAVATDAHRFRSRTAWMADVREMLDQEVSPLCAKTLLEDNPRKILKNERLLLMEPEWFK